MNRKVQDGQRTKKKALGIVTLMDFKQLCKTWTESIQQNVRF
jgi:hypothetical protein